MNLTEFENFTAAACGFMKGATMGLPFPSEWIWYEPESTDVNLYADFFVPVRVEREKHYLLTISADADFAVFLDHAGFPLFFHGYPDTPAHKVYETADLTSLLPCGEHILKITVHCPNKDFSTYRRNRPALRFLLRADGETVAYSSKETQCRKNPHYRSGAIPVVSGQLGFTFDYDACAEDTPTQKAVVLSDMPETVVPRPLPRLQTEETAEITAVRQGVWCDRKDPTEFAERPAMRMQQALLDTADPPMGTYTLYDLGREETGYLAFVSEAEAPTELLIGYGEHLWNNRCHTAIGNRNFAVRIKVPAGKFEFFAPFLRFGLRYLQVFAVGTNVTVSPSIRRAVYPVTEKPYYAPLGTVHEKIERIARRTLHLCMHDHYEDCPWREQALYAMDGRNEMLAAFYAFGETEMTAASLRLMADSLRKDSLLELCSPARVPITIPSFSAAFVIALREYFDASGDRKTVNDLLPVAYEILSGFYGRMKHHNWMLPAYRQKEYWNFYEWSEGLSGTIGKEESPEEMTYDAPLMAFAALACTAYAELLMKIGKEDGDDAGYEQGDAALHCSEELCERLNEYFWDEEKGLYRTYLGISLSDCSPIVPSKPHYAELTQVLCVLCGAVDDARLDALLDRIYKKDGLIPSTLSMGIYRYEALLKAPERYAPLVLDEIAERFSVMLDGGATTFWEVEEGASAFKEAGSLCHGWSAFPIYLYAKYHALFFGGTPKHSTRGGQDSL